MYLSRPVYEYISQIMHDPIIEWRKCIISWTEFPIFQSDHDFLEKASPVYDGLKYPIPLPIICPTERERLRLSFRNERKLYKRKCDYSWNTIVTIYSSDAPYVVYDRNIRLSDQRNALDYGKVFDPEKSFFTQFDELIHVVPRRNVVVTPDSEWATYSHITISSKNIYMSFSITYSENVLYTTSADRCVNCMDCFNIVDCELCYGCVMTESSQKCFFCFHSKKCFDCRYCEDCENCSSCIGCIGLINKQYCIDNTQVSKEEFQIQVEYIKVHGRDQTQSTSYHHTPRQYAHISQSENSFGDYIRDSKNGLAMFVTYANEDCRYMSRSFENKDCRDGYGIGKSELIYNSVAASMGASHCSFCTFCIGSHYLLYCDNCDGCTHCFACAGLRNKEYCIFNTQYSKADYETEVVNIITHMIQTGEWWQFFPSSLSPFGYNQTIAQDIYPAMREEFVVTNTDEWSLGTSNHQLTTLGYKRSDYNTDITIPLWAVVLQGDNIPSDAKTVSDDILQSIFICEVSAKPFVIQKKELELLRLRGLPLPRRHHDVRHRERSQHIYNRKLYLRSCDQTEENVVSIYPPREISSGNKSFPVYGERAYQNFLYG